MDTELDVIREAEMEYLGTSEDDFINWVEANIEEGEIVTPSNYDRLKERFWDLYVKDQYEAMVARREARR